ncbi:M10 family metallopeptidase C-terminal domain-containing protein [uncultured Xylophilus sp.]|uniref:M10 family metallopeptidase C-terminal domain-containing protein n=1 Tax=uncultured Xylophilus sp. TaxID=296832 RepID=UPI0025DD2941|nr:M10 family metallopeptidase C-terminal domain-containing protein [uncultured Xylophilus sp.]
MATATKPPTKSVIANFFQVLTIDQPGDSLLTALSTRVDSGTATLGDALRWLYASPSVAQSPADNLARFFFLLFDRAPDAGLYNLAMQFMRGGASMLDVARIGLSMPGLALSNDGLPNSVDFAQAFLVRTKGLGNFTQADVLAMATGLDIGQTTRAQLLVDASGTTDLAVASEAMVETSLLYLAGAGREASRWELDQAAGSTTGGRIVTALAAAGLSATGGRPALDRNGSDAKLSGDLASDIVWDMAAGSYKLGGSTAFKVFFTQDCSLTGSVADFAKVMAAGSTSFDARDTVGKGKVTFVGDPVKANSFWAPVGGSSAVGGRGDDILRGNDGVDVLEASAGRDTLTGGAGDDRFVLAASSVYQTGTSTTTITDFGNGKDTLDFSKLLNKAVDISKLTANLATGNQYLALANGGVALVENNGAWVSGTGTATVSRAATASDVAALFGTGKLFASPLQVIKSVVITADTRTSADLWLIVNNTGVTQITDGITGPQEVFHVAHLDGSWNASLVGVLPVVV